MRGNLLRVGMGVAVLAELQWASAFLAGGDLVQVGLIVLAAFGLALTAFSRFDSHATWRRQALPLGLTIAALAHAIYIFSAGAPFEPGLLNGAAWGVAIGLGVATIGGWRGAAGLRTTATGLFVAAGTAILWILGDAQAGDLSFMIGNVLAPLGLAIGGMALVAPEPSWP